MEHGPITTAKRSSCPCRMSCNAWRAELDSLQGRSGGAPGGRLVMAGLLARHVVPLQSAYADWIDLEPVAERDGWVCLAGRRPRA